MPGSNDVSLSTTIGKIGLSVKRPNDNEMYGLFFEHNGTTEEVAMIGGSTAEAEKVYEEAQKILESGTEPEAAKQAIKKFIVELHGGTRE